MKMFSYVKVTVSYTWNTDACEFTFGSVKGAKQWIRVNKPDLRWYAIEEYDICPCKDDDTDGQLYYGMTYSEYWEPDKHEEMDFREEEQFIMVTI